LPSGSLWGCAPWELGRTTVFADGIRGAGDRGGFLTRQDARVTASGVGLVRGRFEALFEDADVARAAARDARAVGFAVDVPRETAHGWLIVGRRKLPFSTDDRDRYASRVDAIATQHGGAFSRFVEEPPEADELTAAPVDP
jgi:hypothetical protein